MGKRLRLLPGSEREMGQRLLPGSDIFSRSPPMAERRCHQKLQEVVRRHQECRMAFQDLRSQIKSGLLEASDVFVSLSVPLMKLVGMKAEEMAGEGKSSTIVIGPEHHTRCFSSIPLKNNGFDRRLGKEGNGFAQEHAVSGDLCHRSDEEVAGYRARAKEACEEISGKQKLSAQRLVRLLRGIGVHLNARQESIHCALDSTRGSFRHFIERAASFLSSLPGAGQQQSLQAQSSQDATVRLAAKVLHAAHKHVSSALEDVEEEVDSLLRALAEATCGPMAAHVRELQADAEGGAPARVAALVGEMETALRELTVEAAAARKRARVAEEERAEAVKVCQAMQSAATMVGPRKAQPKRSPICTSPRLPVASHLVDRGTNGIDGFHVPKTSITSPCSFMEPGPDLMSGRMVVTRSRARRYASCVVECSASCPTVWNVYCV